jgi:hypothetical protein
MLNQKTLERLKTKQDKLIKEFYQCKDEETKNEIIIRVGLLERIINGESRSNDDNLSTDEDGDYRYRHEPDES